MHPNLRLKLSEQLAESIPSSRVNNNIFPVRMTTFFATYKAAEILPGHGEYHEKLLEHIGEQPLFEFVQAVLAEMLSENCSYKPDIKFQKLDDIENFDLDAVAPERLLDQFSSLPWNYRMVVELPDDLSTDIRKIIPARETIGTIEIEPTPLLMDAEWPLGNLPKERDERLFNRSLSSFLFGDADNKDRKWKPEKSYLLLTEAGFVDTYGTTEPCVRINRRLKSFFGLCFALRIFRYKRNISTKDPKFEVKVFEDRGQGYQLRQIYELPSKIALAVVGISGYFNGVSEDKQSAAIKWANHRISDLSVLFEDEKKFRSLLTAGEWLFDATTNDEELLGFVQSMVCLEILLGDEAPSNEETLSATLRNRCAYLIAEDANERREILTKFSKIYTVRSKIVHRGKSRLNMEERGLLSELNKLCERVIRKELELLLKIEPDSSKA